MVSIIVLSIVFVAIAVRQIGKIRLQIWQVMLFGAVAVLITAQITPLDALKAINPDVMLFLFGMFVIGQAMESSGYLSHFSYKIFGRAGSTDALVLLILFGAGIASAFLTNDTLAIIGTPVVLTLARKSEIKPGVLLLALAFAITTGSVMSPIGNPQNLLIAVNGNVTAPFITFFKYLFLPTVLNLFAAYLILRLFYRDQFRKIAGHAEEPVQDPKLARLCKISLALVAIMIVIKISVVVAGLAFDFRLTYIALISALPVLFSPKRVNIIKKIDWCTLVFFASMFVLMESVWDSGFFQSILNNTHANLVSLGTIFSVGILLSQLISNVPLVALYLPTIVELGASTKAMVALAAASTIAGNLTILGAASNVIIIQNAEQKSGKTLTFFDFVKVGAPLTVINVAIYWGFLSLVP